MEIFSKEELRDLAISILVVTFIFSYAAIGNFGLSKFHIYLLVVLTAFVFHELAHKFMAVKFGYIAFYKMWALGLIFALIVTLATGGRFVFIAPGAVMIFPFGKFGFRKVLTKIKMGWIGLAGPSVNIIFAAFFRIFQGDIFGLLSMVNAWLAFFNLLPIPPLDGSKIMRWNIWIWILIFIISILLVWF